MTLPPPSFLYGSTAGAVLYIAFRSLSPVLTSALGTKSFRRNVASLDEKRAYDYHSLLPSTVHALAQIVGTYAVVFYGREGYDLSGGSAASSSPAITFDERIVVPYGATRLGPTVYMGVFVGYLLADVAAAPSLHALGHAFAVHHVAASACWTFAACHRVMQPVACLFQFNELSTPLMNLRQYLLTAGYASSDLPVAASSLTFFATFGLVRVAPLPFVLRDWMYRDYGAVRDRIGTGGAILFSLFFAVNALLQCGWFFIICQRFVGVLSKKTKEKVQ